MKLIVEIHDPQGRITAKEIEQRLKAAWLYPAVKVRVVKECLTTEPSGNPG